MPSGEMPSLSLGSPPCSAGRSCSPSPELRSVIPFGEDPYDAVGSFGTTVGMLVALVSLGRAFRPYHEAPPSTAQRVYLVRSQAAVVLVVLMTLAADTVAMARHPSMWIRTASRNGLMALLGSLAVVAVAVQLLIRASQHELPETGPNRWKRAGIAALLAVLVLVLYPEQLINRTATHLLTVVVGAFTLFAPLQLLLPHWYRIKRTKSGLRHQRAADSQVPDIGGVLSCSEES